ncbi:MAG: hypothetical protein HYS17_09600 [Micavibrio aeruginosavorus]|uniref:DUF2946 domain-containing protein n=1 Tax=Micavibrio aeruginosavorus TaxID=349221 RepID=A0A7T5R1E7_9BACT|nr:MAG: hypothetical protein HYS17_09600 [Micavibrio aeruginosavorus]
MKQVVILSVVLLFIGILMPVQARAHGLEQHGAYTASSSGDTVGHSKQSVSVKKEVGDTINLSSSEYPTQKSCNGSCCGFSMCCMTGLPANAALGLESERNKQAIVPYRQSLPQGPPYSLLRPPRFSA